MNHVQLACYGLIASAFILAALLLVQTGQEQSAQADMVIARDNFTVLTAQTANDEEALFMLDNATGNLMIYAMERGQLRLVGGQNIGQAFNGGNRAGGGR